MYFDNMKIFFLSVITILIIMNIIISIFFIRNKRTQLYYLEALRENSIENISIRENWESVIQNAGTYLNLSLMDDESKCVLKDFFKQNNCDKIFVCRFSELNCEKCINYAVEILQHCDTLIRSKLLYIADYHDNRIFCKQRELYGINSACIINVKNLQIPIEDINKPYFFILDSTFHVFDLFIPDISIESMKIKYFEMIKNKHFK